MKKVINLIDNLVNTILDLVIFLFAIDSGFSVLGLVCAIYVAIRFLALDSRELMRSVDIAADSICEWFKDRKEMKEMIDETEVIEDI